MSTNLSLQFSDPNAAVAVLDIGTSKVACLIAELSESLSTPRVLGFARSPIFGVRREAVTDAQALSACLQATLAEAEQMAGLKPEKVFVSFAGGMPEAHLLEGEVSLPSGRVDEDAFARVLKVVGKLEAETLDSLPDRALLHTVPISYSVGQTHGVSNPYGLHADKFSLWVNVVTVERNTEQNLRLALSSLQGRALRIVAAPWASALAALDEDERELGAVVVDLGAEITSLAYMEESQLLYMATLPMGGNEITRVLARRFSTGIEHAERAKVLHGHALPRVAMPYEVIDLPQVGVRGTASLRSVPRSELLTALHEETTAILRKVAEQMAVNPLLGQKDRGVVLVGGGALLPEIATLAEEILGRKVRQHVAVCPENIPAWAHGADYASIFGALLWASTQETALPLETPVREVSVVRHRRGRARVPSLVTRLFGALRVEF